MNADYINWFPLNKKEIKNVILVKEANDSDKDRSQEKTLFKAVTISGKIQNRYARETGTTIYLLKDATTSINILLQQEILKRKKEQ